MTYYKSALCHLNCPMNISIWFVTNMVWRLQDKWLPHELDIDSSNTTEVLLYSIPRGDNSKTKLTKRRLRGFLNLPRDGHRFLVSRRQPALSSILRFYVRQSGAAPTTFGLPTEHRASDPAILRDYYRQDLSSMLCRLPMCSRTGYSRSDPPSLRTP